MVLNGGKNISIFKFPVISSQVPALTKKIKATGKFSRLIRTYMPFEIYSSELDDY